MGMTSLSGSLLFFKKCIRDSLVASSTTGNGSERVWIMVAFGQGVYLAWEPWNIPARNSSVVLDHDFKVLELDEGDSIECDIQKNERPFKEGIDCVGFQD